MQESVGVILLAVFAVSTACSILTLNRWLGPKKKPTPLKREPYECGVQPFELPTGPQDIRFFAVALVFLVLDAALALLYLWALNLRLLPLSSLAFAGAFLALLALGFLVVWKKGVFEWK